MNESSLNGPADAGHEHSDKNESQLTPGRKLASLREERGWSIEQVAGQLNLAPRQVVAIETDDYANLPGTAVTRGFIRAYAKLLQVEPTPFLTLVPGANPLMEATSPARKTLSTEVPKSRFPSMSDRSRSAMPIGKIVGLVVVALVVAGGWFFYRGGGLSSMPKSLAPTQEQGPTVSERVPVPALPQTAPEARTATTPGTVTSTPDTPPSVPATPSPSAGTTPPSAAVPGTAASISSPTNTAASTPSSEAAITSSSTDGANGKADGGKANDGNAADALVLTMHADSWIELKRPDNTVIVSKVAKAGSQETFQLKGKGPVTLVVGNASGVDASLRGKALDLKANKVNNVARLKLN